MVSTAFNAYISGIEDTEVSADRFAVESGEDALTMVFTDPEWVVEGLVSNPSVNLLVGEGGTCKSLWMQSLTLALVTGQNFLGQFAVPEPRRVLYVQSESGKRGFFSRFKRLAKGLGISSSDLSGRLHLLTNTPFQLDNGEDIAWLVKHQIKPKKFDVVIFDPLRDLHSKDENSSEQMKPIADALRYIRDACGTSCIVAHHTNKGPDYIEGADRSRGTTALWNWMDGRWYVKHDSSKVWSVMDHLYLKEHGTADLFRYRPAFEDTDDSIYLEFDLIDNEGRSKSSNKARDILRPHDELPVLQSLATRGKATYKDMEADTKLALTSVKQACKQFANRQWAIRIDGNVNGGRGNKAVFEITAAGRNALK